MHLLPRQSAAGVALHPVAVDQVGLAWRRFEHLNFSERSVSEMAARTIDLTGEVPSAMGYCVLGLTMKAHRDNRSEDAATLAGYLSAHLEDLQLYRQPAESIAGGSLERFVSPATQPEFEQGQAMNAADLRRELERLAGRA